MSDFFYRQASVDLPTGGRIRNNAWVTITSDSGFSLPTNATSQTDTYNPNKTGRPAPILKDVPTVIFKALPNVVVPNCSPSI